MPEDSILDSATGLVKKAASITPAGIGAKIGEAIGGGAGPEAEAPQETEVVDRAGSGTAVQGGTFSVGNAPKLPELMKAKTPTSAFTLTGTQVAGLSEANQAVAAETQKRLEEAGYLDGASQLLALKASERETANLAFVNEHASDLIEDLRINHFPQARAKIQKLQQDVDDARAMKINPYNWHESIGRGGRVAAAFSLLTGQLAAGAGNPNTALQMMDAAIERDIAAQDQNIKNQFEGVKLQKGLLQDERELLTEEMAAVNTNRAMKYAAIVARIQYAEQHAISESARLSLITMKDHYNVRLLQAIAAANAQYMTLHVKGPLRTRTEEADLRRIIKTKAALQEQLDASVEGQQALQASQTPIALSTGETAADLGFVGGPQQAQQQQALPADQAQAAAVASRRPSKGRRPDAGTRTPSGTETAPDAPSTEPERTAPDRTSESIADRDARLQQETAAALATTLKEAQAKVAAGGRVSKPEMAQILMTPSEQGGGGLTTPKGKNVAKRGGYAMVIAEGVDAPTNKITTVDMALNAVAAKRAIPNNGMQDPRDADLVSSVMPAPSRGAFAQGTGGDRLYKDALRDWQHGQDYPEIYEAPGSLVGQRNSIRAGGRDYRVRRSATNIRTNPAEYKKLAAEMAEMAEGVELLQTIADDIMEAGPSGFFTSDGFGIPGLTNSKPDRAKLKRVNIGGAMQFIKQNDPTARISDQDIKLGFKAMGDMLGGTFKFLDFAQNFAGSELHARKMLRKFFQEVAIGAQATYWKKHENDLVPSAETARVVAEETAKRLQFISTVDKE